MPPEEPWASAPWDEDEDWEWRWSADEDADALRAAWEAACRRTNAIILAEPDLDDLVARQPYLEHEGPDVVVTRRFVLVHLIEEVARHAGHADLIAEAVDGRVGQ